MEALQIQSAINNGSAFMVSRLPGAPHAEIFQVDEQAEDAKLVGSEGNEIKFKKANWQDLNHNKKEDISLIEQSCMDKLLYIDVCQKMISAINNNDAKKIILSRVKEISLAEDQLGYLFDELCAKYPNALVYLYHQKGVSWVGATPELLAAFSGSQVTCASLAGTIPIEDSNWSQKEKDEQQIVTDFIIENIKQFGSIDRVDGPKDLIAGAVRHLQTMIYGTIDNKGAFLKELHPTPAIAGYPVKEALNQIAALENHQRRMYTGYIEFNTPNSTSAYVNLRCLEHQGNKAYLYLGGGITSDSIPENEWHETELKAMTLLSVIEKL